MQLRLECSIVLLYVLAGLLHGQITNKGSCAIFDSKHKFHFAQFYNGGWYIVEGYPNRFYEDSVCHEWSLATDGKYVYINETVFNVKKHDFESLQGKARYQSKGSVNCLLLSPGLKSLPYGADMCIISTDYINYGVVYVCRPVKGKKKQEYIYIISRTPTLEPRLRAKVLIDNIVRGGFQVTPFAPMNQLYCRSP